MNLSRGVFVLSLDFELIWGALDKRGPSGFARECEVERQSVFGALLELLVEYEIPATWCVLGHLFLDNCAPENGRAHPEIVRPRHAWCTGDWFQHDTGGSEASRPAFYGKSLVERLLQAPQPQEIGCHSFSHVIFGDPGCSRETAESELRACLALARERGLRLRSFAFPRNSVGHLDVVREAGFTCFRGPAPLWYERSGTRGPAARAAHLLDVLAATPPPTVLPERVAPGFWDIPASMIYFPSHGLRGMVPISRRVRRALRGVDAAIRTRRVFHLWFHPTNLAARPGAMLEGLRSIFESVAAARKEGSLETLSMGALAAWAESAPGPAQ